MTIREVIFLGVGLCVGFLIGLAWQWIFLNPKKMNNLLRNFTVRWDGSKLRFPFIRIRINKDVETDGKRLYPPPHAGGATSKYFKWAERCERERLTEAQAWDIAITEDQNIINPSGDKLDDELIRQTREAFIKGVRRERTKL